MTRCQMKCLFGQAQSVECRVSGPSEKISVAEMKTAIAKMKNNKVRDRGRGRGRKTRDECVSLCEKGLGWIGFALRMGFGSS